MNLINKFFNKTWWYQLKFKNPLMNTLIKEYRKQKYSMQRKIFCFTSEKNSKNESVWIFYDSNINRLTIQSSLVEDGVNVGQTDYYRVYTLSKFFTLAHKHLKKISN